ncbi:MAG TPA: PAS domain S-box protein [Holophaga sp.]|nr:PAS domain S-box protein [Holophaga sp.]
MPTGASKASEIHRLAQALWEERAPLRKERCKDLQTLVQELGVQRLELELRYEDLLATNNEIWRSLEHYTELHDFAPAACLTLMANGRIGEAGFAAARLLGVERSRLIGASIFDFIEETCAPRFRAFLQESGRAPAPCGQLESRLRRKDGTLLHILLSAVSGEFIPTQGRSVRVALVNISEQVQAREALQAELSSERTLFEASPVFQVVLDTGGRIARINRQALATLGYDREGDVLGRDWFTDCLAAPGTRRLAGFRELMESGGEGKTGRLSLRRRDGSRTRLEIRETLLRDPAGRIIGLLATGQEPSR